MAEKKYTTCKACGQEKKDGIDCLANREVMFPDGVKLPSVPHDDEDGNFCHDCGVAPGQCHHVLCDMERCPRCGEQLLSCDCFSDLQRSREFVKYGAPKEVLFVLSALEGNECREDEIPLYAIRDLIKELHGDDPEWGKVIERVEAGAINALKHNRRRTKVA